MYPLLRPLKRAQREEEAAQWERQGMHMPNMYISI